MKLPAMASFTGAGRIRAPKKGESAMIGPMRAMIKKHSESTERCALGPDEFRRNNSK